MGLFKTFGSNPSGKQLERITKSPNYRNGVFHNLRETKMLAENASYFKITWRFFNKPKNTAPSKTLPAVKTDLHSLSSDKPVIIWFGHSSYLIVIKGITFLIDPVFSGHASPFSFAAKSFKGSDIYSVYDLPRIDVLLLTHDHYDHLDFSTILKLKSKVKIICTPYGVGSHLEYWGVDRDIIQEFDWWDSKDLGNDISKLPVELIAAPARHFSGRGLVRNKTLWSSFILRSGEYSIYIGSDSGYDTHFKTIGDKFGPFDIAILEAGQYNEDWPDIHLMPEDTVHAAVDLRAKVLLPVHWGKFAIALHPWDEPVKRVLAKAKELSVQVTTPLIGEPIVLHRSYPGTNWWEGY